MWPLVTRGACLDASAELYSYDSMGRRETTNYEDNVVRTHTYDQASRLTKVAETTGSASPTLESMDGTAVVGNFDGDTEEDVFFYRSTATADDDYVFWGAARNQFGSVNGNFSVGAGYTPVAGDFNCDGRDDILWYKPGSDSDVVWFWFGRYDTSAPNGDYISKAFTMTDTFVPVAGDFNGDDCSDVLWYAPGTDADAIWWGDDDVAVGTNQFDLGSTSIGGNYEPVAGDFDGNGADDVFWYAPGTTQDYLWMFAASGGTYTSYTRAVNTSGHKLASGDVDGDGRDDLLFTNPVGADYLWWGQANPTNFHGSNQAALSIGTGVTSVLGDFDGDAKADLYLYKGAASGDDIWWGAAPADFATAAGGTGFKHLTTTHETVYTYGADGVRATKQVDGGSVQEFTYSAGAGLPLLLARHAAAGTTYLVYGPGGQPIEQVNPDGSATWLHHDQLGSVRLATKATDGAESSRRTFDAYGTTATHAAASGATQPLLGYAGQYTDTETGYQYLRARYYDPTTAQFLTIDPLVAQTQEPYGYAGSNPSRMTDPSGLCSKHGGLGGYLRDRACAAGEQAQGYGKFVSDHKTELLIAGAVVAVGACAVASAGLCLEAGVVLAESGGMLTAELSGTAAAYGTAAAAGEALVIGSGVIAVGGLAAIPAGIVMNEVFGCEDGVDVVNAGLLLSGGPGSHPGTDDRPYLGSQAPPPTGPLAPMFYLW